MSVGWILSSFRCTNGSSSGSVLSSSTSYIVDLGVGDNVIIATISRALLGSSLRKLTWACASPQQG